MSNISEPFDIRKMANEILGTALPPIHRWYDDHENIVRLGAVLVLEGYDAEQLQRFYEKPWKWTPEFEAMALEACSGKVLDALVAEADSEGEKMQQVLSRPDRWDPT